MSALKAFLNPISFEETKKVEISKRFVEDGNPVPFEIRTISQEQNSALIKKHTRSKLVNGNRVEIFDNPGYTNSLLVACTVQPDFKDADLCAAYGCVDPEDVPGKMLLSGEFAALVRNIMQFNGFDPDSLLKEDEEAKNL